MRLTVRRSIAAFTLLVAAGFATLAAAPVRASASDCYTVQWGNQGATVCPWG
jgi:hypothetical protein